MDGRWIGETCGTGCDVDSDGVLIIHRDIPGDHDALVPEHCWCEPHVIREDDLRTPQQIVEDVSVKEFRN
jgi:hypothetical protein